MHLSLLRILCLLVSTSVLGAVLSACTLEAPPVVVPPPAESTLVTETTIVTKTVEAVYHRTNSFGIRNDTTMPLYVAIAHWDFDAKHWISEGWFEIGSGKTRKLLAQYRGDTLYYRAFAKDGAVWDGSAMFAVDEDAPFRLERAAHVGPVLRGFAVANLGHDNNVTISIRE